MLDSSLLIFSFLQKMLFAVGPFIILLGILIFIHELGHFLAARIFGVEVQVFSLGFGPKILKYKKGPTTYCVSLLPLGGYVKMFGDNPLIEPAESEKAKAFLYKKTYQKWLIAFAGPLFNLIFTLIAFFGLALSGLKTLPAQLGDIDKDSPAYERGFRSGDRILFAKDQSLTYLEELEQVFSENIGQELSFTVKEESGRIKEILVPIQEDPDPPILDSGKKRGHIEGLSYFSKGLKVGVLPDSPAYKQGLRSFDTLLEVNGQKLRYWRQLEPLSLKDLKVERGKTKSRLSLKEALSLEELGLEPSFLYIEKVGPDTPAFRAGLKKGDRLVAFGAQSLKSWEQVLKIVGDSKGRPLKLSYQRGPEIKTVSIKAEALFVEGNIKERYMLGMGSGGLAVTAKEIVRNRNIGESLQYAFLETKKWLSVTVKGLALLIKGDISVRTMGGPIAIGRVAHSSFSQGWSYFLMIMAIISINLFFLNLLPIPALDGGHLLFFSLEALLRRPLNVKKLLIAQNIGLVFLLLFMGLVIINDIYNWLSAW